MSENVLELRGLSKSFGTNQVLYDVDFSLRPGEVHAIIGENGAGKSTMMNIVYGLVKPNAGEIYIDGNQVTIKNPTDAQKLGICFVHQEIALCQDVSVAENIYMSRIRGSKQPMVNFLKLNKDAQELLDSIVPGIKATAQVDTLNIAAQQVVEIAKALSTDCKILILDEPTSSLSETETEALYEIMRNLKKRGIGIIYISHRLAEIFEQCDRVSVLRDGYMINTYEVSGVDSKQLVSDMAGREVDNLYTDKAEHLEYTDDNVLLDVQDLNDVTGIFKNVSFKLHKGEVLGFSGLVGSGRTEVMESIVGLRKCKPGGKVIFEGKNILNQKSQKTFDSGLVYLPEDRKQTGLFLEMGIHENTSSLHIRTVCNGSFISKKKEIDQAKKFVDMLRTKCASPTQPVNSLSGGNQQKVLFSKMLTETPKIFLADEPTRGIDVGAKSELHTLLRNLANEGTGVIVVSSELNEIIGMCDRVLAMYEGEIVAEIKGDDVHSKNIMHYISGAYRLDNEGEAS